MNKTYRAAIIGLGFIGAADQVSGDALGQQVSSLDGTHLSALTNHPQVELVAGSSRDQGRRDRFAQRTGARTYAEWHTLLAAEQLDIVSVATYSEAHAEITLAAVAAGVRVIYCEKPIANCVAAADRMVQACDAAGALLVINHNRRFHPTFRRLRDLIGAGELGELTSASLEWGSGRLANVGTHLFDALVMVTGQPISAVAGTLDLAGKPDCRGERYRDYGGWGLLRLRDGLMTTVNAADYTRAPIRLAINGAQGRVVVEGNTVQLEFWDGRRTPWSPPGKERSSMDQAVAEIVAWLDGVAPFPYAAAEAVSVLEAITAFHLSHQRNAAWVDLPLTGADRSHVIQCA